LSALERTEKDALADIGYDAIRQGHVCSVILSGGQGTRLGFHGPKGMYDFGLPSRKTIFQLHIERINKVYNLCKNLFKDVDIPNIPIYIMTSDLNHRTIQEYFKERNYFNYPKEDIFFFEQGVEPCWTLDGKLIIESLDSLAFAPDGNGGVYRALETSGALQDMTRRGVQHLHIYGIDNVLVKSIDPGFIGLSIRRQVECANKVVWRASKSEKVGITVQRADRMWVIEYSETPSGLGEAEDASGQLIFGAANICNHYMHIAFIRDKVLPAMSTMYHKVIKKIPFWDFDKRATVSPLEPNGVKLESFIFDVFPLASEWAVMSCDREDEFAPIKNEPGNPSDSPDTARNLISAQGQKWLRAVGASVEGTGVCEISPLLSYAGEGLESYAERVISLPCYLEKL